MIRDEEEFFDMTSRYRDLGIESFQYRLQHVCDELSEKYRGRNDVEGEVVYDEIDQALEQFNDEWQFYGQAATLTGRVYMYDNQFRDAFPEEWKEEYDDFHDEKYFFLNEKTLYSGGIDIAPIWDAKKNTFVGVEPLYKFCTDADVDDYYGNEFLLFARPDDLQGHTYDIPSIDEIEWRLERRWPEVRDAIDGYVTSRSPRQIPTRLNRLAFKIQAALRSSDELASYVERSVNSHLRFDEDAPYNFTIKAGGFDLWNDDETPPEPLGTSSESEQWVRCESDDDISVFGYNPHVRFVKDKTGEVRPLLVATVLNSESIEPEYIRVDVTDVEDFLSTRLAHSIGVRALWPETMADIERLGNGAAASADVNDNDKDKGGETFPIVIEAKDKGPLEAQYDYYESIDSMIRLASEKLSELVKDSRYESLDEASTVAHRLSGEMFDEFNSALPLLSLYVRASGGVMVPRTKMKSEYDGSVSSYSFSVDTTSFEVLERNDYVDGVAEKFVGYVSALKVGDVSIGYAPRVGLLLRRADKTMFHRVNIAGVLASAVQSSEYFIMPLNENTDFSIPAIDSYKQARKNIVKTTEYYGKDARVVRDIKRLATYLATTALDNEMVSMKNIALFTRLSNEVNDLADSEKGATRALNTLDALLVHRNVTMVVLADGQDEKAAPGATGRVVRQAHILTGEVVDIRTDKHEGDVTIIVEDDDGESYEAPFKQIIQFLC